MYSRCLVLNLKLTIDSAEKSRLDQEQRLPFPWLCRVRGGLRVSGLNSKYRASQKSRPGYISERSMPPKKSSAKKRPVKNKVDIGIRLEDIRLLNSRSFQAITQDSLPQKSKINISVEVGGDNDDKRSVIACPTVVFSAWYDDGSPEEPAIVVDAAFQMRYGLQPTINAPSRDKVVDAITHMCMLHSWPYFREFIHSHINRMGLPAILLPLFVVSPNAVQRAKSKKSTKKSN